MSANDIYGTLVDLDVLFAKRNSAKIVTGVRRGDEDVPVVTKKTDPVTGKPLNLTAGSTSVLALKTASLKPYRLATFGDSRANSGGQVYGASPNGPSGEKVPGCLSRIRGDIQIVFNGGVSGGTTANWNNNTESRVTNKQTVADMLLTCPDMCYIQFGINDIIGAVADATVIANLKDIVNRIVGAGIPVIFESINPCATGSISYINGYSAAGGYGASFAAKQASQIAINAAMQAWLAQFPGNIALYVDTSSVSTAADGYAKADKTYSDGTHMSSIGTMSAAALINTAMLPYWPLRYGQRLKPLYSNPTNRSMLTPTTGRAAKFSAIANESGTATATYSVVVDDEGDLCQEYNVTVSALASGASVQRFDILTDVTGATPILSLVAGDVVQGAVDYYIDNGDGGAPIAANVFARLRMYYDATYNTRTTVYTSHGGTTGAALGSTDHPALPAAERGKLLTGAVALDTDSTHLTVSSALQVYLFCNQLGTYRLRVKNPQCCKVTGSVLSVTPPATTVAYSNTTQTNQQVIVSGGTVTVIAINGVATGLTSGVFTLNPGDSLTPTYSVAPTFLVKPI